MNLATADRSTVFTRFVQTLAAQGPEAHGDPEVWRALRAALVRELRRRGLWELSPSLLGVFGGASWEAEGPGASTALEELVTDAYEFVFHARERSLRAQLQVKDNLEGLVILSLRNFLHERQREHDPLGTRLYEVLHGALQQALAAGRLAVVAGDPRVRNDTVLGVPGGSEPVSEAALEAIVARWCDELLPDLVTARGKERRAALERLADGIESLVAGGRQFQFKDLITPLKQQVRGRWAALLGTGDERLGVVPGGEEDPPDEAAPRLTQIRVEERDAFRALVECVLTGLAHLETDDRSRRYLAVLWEFLRVQASDGPSRSAARAPAPSASADPADEPARWSQRQLASLLGIPRERIGPAFETIGRLVENCRRGGAHG